MNLPIGVATIVAAMLIIPDLRPGRRHRLDFLGVALATAGLLGVVYGLIEGQRFDWGTVTGFVTIPEIIAAGVALLLIFVFYQASRQRGEPLLPFAVFGDRNFSISTVVLFAMGFSIVGLYLPLTIYFQSVLELSAQDAGIATAVQPISMMLLSGVAAGLSQKMSPKFLLTPGLVLFAAGSAYIPWAAHVGANRWIFTSSRLPPPASTRTRVRWRLALVSFKVASAASISGRKALVSWTVPAKSRSTTTSS